MRSVASPWRIVGVCVAFVLLLARVASAQVVATLNPPQGPSSGGTSVTIAGEGFIADPLPTVTFAGVPGVVQNATSNSITVLTPAFTGPSTASQLAVNVTVTNSGGTSTVANTAFNYQFSFFLASVSPSSVPIAGGAEVTIRGAGFTSDATVEFGGSPATAVVVDDATQIRAVAPAHAAGAVDVVVRINGGASSATMANGISFGPAVVVGASGPLTKASVGWNGVPPSGDAGGVTMSRNGKAVVFGHPDNGLVVGDTNNLVDLFVRDLDQQTTQQINVHQNGSPGAGLPLNSVFSSVAVSPDGRYVAFVTPEALDVADTNGVLDVYVRDRVGNTTIRASLTAGGGQISTVSNFPIAISANGRYVSFTAEGTGVVTADTVNVSDVFVRDLVANTTVMVSVTSAGTPGAQASLVPSMSDDGRFVVFESFANNLASGITGNVSNIFLHDRDTDEDGTFDEADAITTTLVSAAPSGGGGGNGGSSFGRVSPDGSLVLFGSKAFNLVADDTNSWHDVFLWVRQTGAISRISVGPGGVEANRESVAIGQPFGGGNRYLAFASGASNLVPLDGNGAADVFVFDRVTGGVTLVSTSADGTRSDSGGFNRAASAAGGAISDDGTRISLGMSGVNLADNDTGGNSDAFVKTIVSNVLTVTGAPETATFGTNFTVSSIGGGAGAVTFATSGACTNTSGGALITMSSGTGTCDITATDGVNTSAAANVTALRAAQSPLSINNAPASAVTGTTFVLVTSGGSGSGALTFARTGVCSNVDGGASITMTSGAGTCSITATKAVDANYEETLSPTVTVVALQVGGRLVEWVADTSGTWEDATKWTDGIVPATGDVVRIDRPSGSFTITVNSSTANIQTLYSTETLIVPGALTIAGNGTLAGGLNLSGTLAGAGSVVLNGPATWTSGFVNVASLEVAVGQTLTISTGGDHWLVNSLLRNRGTVIWTGGRLIYQNASAVSNEVGALWDAQNDLTVVWDGSGGAKTFTNLGTFRKSAGIGAVSFGGVSLTNATGGTIEALTGGLVVSPATNSGHMTVGSGVTLSLANWTLQAGTSLSGAGALVMDGTTTVAVDLTLPLPLTLSSTVTGAGTLTLAAPMTWTSGFVSVPELIISTGQTLTISTGGDHQLTNSLLRNRGTVIWTGGRLLYQHTSEVRNEVGALWDAQNDLTVVWDGTSGVKTFTNLGTFRKSAGTGVVSFGGVSLTNATGGTIEALSGGLLVNPATNSGHMTVGSGVTLSLANWTLQAGTSFSGAGALDINGTTTVAVDLTVSLPLTLSSTVTGVGTLTLAAPMTWASGFVSLPELIVSSGQTLTISTGADHWLVNSVLRNRGTVVWTGGRLIYQNASAVSNEVGALWDAQNDLTVVWDGSGGAKTFTNLGTFRKSAGIGVVSFGGVSLTNATGGTIEALSGGLLVNPATSSGHMTVGSGVTLSLANWTLQAGTSFSGAGALDINGTTTVAVDLTVPLPLTLSSTVTGAGTLTLAAPMTWTSGFVSVPELIISTGQTLTISTGGDHWLANSLLRNRGTVIWTGGRLIYQNASAVSNEVGALWEAQNDLTVVWDGSGGAKTFTNFGTFRKSAGAGVVSFGGVSVSNATGGTIEVLSGGLSLNPATNSGHVTVGSGVALSLANWTLQAGTSFSGAGALAMDGTTTVAADLTVPLPLTLSSTVTGLGTLTLAAPMTWTNGFVSLPELIVSTGQTLTISTGGDHWLVNSLLRNRGTVIWTGGRLLYQNVSAVINEAGALWEAQGDLTVVWDGSGGAKTFTNLGTFRKSAGTGAVSFGGVLFESTGTIGLRLGGTAAGQFDRIVAGTVTLGGTLDVHTAGGFTPAVGNQFNVLSYASLNGAFATVSGNGVSYNATYPTGAVVLETVGLSTITPVITWPTPAAITYGTPLTAAELNATSGAVAGTFAYTPPSGTLLNAGNGQTLSVLFTPSDTNTYNTNTASVLIDVLRAPQVPVLITGAPTTATSGTSFTVGMAGGSTAGAVTFFTAGACSNLGPVVTMTSGSGTCTIAGTKAGDANYLDVSSPQIVVTATAAPSIGASVIGGFNAARAAALSIVDGSELSTLRSDLAAMTSSPSLVGTTTLNDVFLSTIDVALLSSVTSTGSSVTALTPAEQVALQTFVLNGGGAVILVDDDSAGANASLVNNSFLAPFGVHVTGTGAGAATIQNPAASPVTSGPFGTVSQLNLVSPGWFDTLGPATSLGTLDMNGMPVLAVIPRDALGAGSGAVVFVSNTDLANAFWNADYRTLVFNAIAYVAPASRANLVENGSFETPVQPPGGYTRLFAPNTFDGWTVSAGSIDLVGTLWQAADGVQSVDLSGDVGSAGEIYQDIPTNPGQLYTLSFKLAADVQGGPTIKSVEVFWGGNSIGTFTFDLTGHTETSMGWAGQAVAGLAATGTTTRLLFKDLTASGFGAALDDVRVIPSSVAPAAPVITWGAPAPITFGTPLSAVQLNATTTVPGTFVYTPSSGTLLQAGVSQTLSVTFTPDDPIHYLPASASVSIDVVQGTQAALSVTGAPSSAPNGFSFAVSTSGGSGSGAVTFAVTGPCSIAGSQVTITGSTGTCSITATKAADPNFLEVVSAPAMVSATSASLIQWISDASGFWDEAANWSGNHVPANGDQVVIDRPAGNFTITIRTPTANIQTLYATEALSVSSTLTVAETGSLLGGITVSGTLTGAGTIVVGGPANWVGGTVSLQGGLDIAAGQTLTMTGDLVVTDSALRNYGTVAWSGGRLGYMSTAHVTNQAGGVWDVRGDLRLENFGSSGTKTFTNLGTLRKTVGIGALTVNASVFLTNPGRIELETGVIAFEGAANNSGHLALAGGTILNLANVTLEGTTTFSGTGTLNFSGTTTIPSALTIPLTTTMSSAIVTGAGTLTMAAPTTAGSTVVALVGGLEIETGHTLTVVADFIFPDSSLRNRGTVVWSGGRMGFQSATAIVNQASGVWDVRGDLRLENFGSSGTKTFTNLGTLRKTVGIGALTVNGSVYLTNPGRIELETGAIAFEGPSNNSGHLALAGGTTFQLGNVTLEGTTTFSGTGTLNFSGTTTIPSALTIPLTTTMSSAIVTGAGTLTMAAPTTAGSTVVALVGGLEIETGHTLTVVADFIFPDSSLRNRGTVVWSGGRMGFQSATAIVNQAGGVWDVRGDLRLENFGSSGTKTFTNLGTLRKTVGIGALTVNASVFLANPGRIELETGAIAFEGPANNSGHLAVAGGTTFHLANVTLEGTTTFSGTGTLNFSGTTTIPSALTIPLTTTMNSAILNGAGTLTLAAPTTAGSTVVGLGGGLEIAAGHTVTVVSDFIFPDSSLRNRGTVVWTSGRFGFQSSTAIENQAGGVWEVRGDLTLENFGSSGTKTFTNAGTLRRAASPGTLSVSPAINFISTGAIELRVGGSPASGLYDRINAGPVTLAGTLDLTAINGFTPAVDDAFTVLTFSTRSGAFDTIDGNGFNYAPTYNANTLVLGATGVTKVTPVINWPAPAPITYGTALSGVQLNATADVGGTFAYVPVAGTVLGVGTHQLSLTFTPTNATLYENASASVMLTVNPASLQVTAEAKTKIAGQPNPALTYLVTGFVAGETSAVVSGAPLLTTSATDASPAGMYPITIAQGSLSAANYGFSFLNGTLTVTPAPLLLCSAYVPAPPAIHTFAGTGADGFGGDLGLSTLANLNFPISVAVGDGVLFIADSSNHRIRRVNLTTCVIDTVAGTGEVGFQGDGGPAQAARLSFPRGVAVLGGLLYIADQGNSRVRRVNLSTGVITTVAGNGTAFGGDGGAATAAGVQPSRVTVANGALYIADQTNHRIRRVDLASGIITTVAGTGTATFSGDGGPATSARLSSPKDVAVVNGGLFIADTNNHRVRRVDLTTGIITTVAGTGATGAGPDGVQATTTNLGSPTGLVADGDVLYIGQQSNSVVRRLDLGTGIVTRMAGTGVSGSSGDGGPATSAQLEAPEGLAVGPGALFIADLSDQRIRRVDVLIAQAPLTVTGAPPAAANGSQFTVGFSGGSTSGAVTFNASGACSNTSGGALISMTSSIGTCVITATKAGDAYYRTTTSTVTSVAAVSNVALCEGYQLLPGTIHTFAGTGINGFGGDLGLATLANLNFPISVAVGEGVLFIADTDNHRIRRVNLTTCVIDTVAGTGTLGFLGDGGLASAARLSFPRGVAVSGGQLYIADQGNSRVRRVTLSTGVITTVAGNGTAFGGDGGAATAAGVQPSRVTVANGVLFIADQTNHRIRGVDLASGIITTVAGTGTATFSGDGGPATSARLSSPKDVAVVNGDLFIADTNNHRVRRVDLTTGIITTVAGNGASGAGPDGVPATTTNVGNPTGLVADGDVLYISQQSNSLVRRLDLGTGVITRMAGTGVSGSSGDGGLATSAQLEAPEGLAVGPGALFIADLSAQRIRRVDLELVANTAPVAQDGAVTTAEDTAATGSLVATDADMDGLTFSIVSNGGLGTAVVTNATTGAFTYTPTANVSGTDTFTFKVNDGTVDSNTATVTVTITPVNDAPVASDGSLTTPEDTAATGSVSALDIDSPSLTYAIVTAPTKGTVQITDASTGAYLYMPNANASGADAFSFQANDGSAASNVATVTVAISPVNDAPIARAGVVTTTENVAVNGSLSGADLDGDSLTFSVSAPPSKGAVTITNVTAGSFAYTPSAGATGYDSFTFELSDGHGGSSLATEMVFIVANSARWPGQTVRASVSGTGAQANALSSDVTLSADGRLVAFLSSASNLVPGDTNGAADVFVLDRQTGQVTRVSVAGNGTQGNSGSADPRISADGMFVAFRSNASNLVPGDTNGLVDVFVHNRLTAQTTRANVSSGGAQSTTHVFEASALSADGRFVAFVSPDPALVAGDSNGVGDVFVHDNQTGQTARISVASDGSQANNSSVDPKISADGRFVAFQSGASNLVAGDTNADSDIFVHDRQTGQTTRVSVTSSGTQVIGSSIGPTLSADGRFVAFYSGANGFVADANGHYDVFVHDRQTGQTTLESVATSGAQGNVDSLTGALSADGRFVAFYSASSTLTPGDTNGTTDVFVRDRQTLTTTRVNVGNDGAQAAGASDQPALSADGRFAGFASLASDLVAGDTNGVRDAFVVGGVDISPTSASFSAAGGTGSVEAAFVYPGTQWTGSSNDGWITVTNQSSTTGNGTVTYSAAPNGSGSPRTGTLTVGTRTVTIQQEAGAAPIAQVGAVATAEDVAVSGTLIASDPNSDPLTFSIVSNGTLGTAVVPNASTGAFIYTPNANVSGTDSFTFKANDGQADSNVATVTVTITPVNDAPVAVDAYILTSYTAAANIHLSASDIDSSSLTFSIVTNGAKGTANITNGNEFQYIPNPGASGTDVVTVKASDGTTDSNIATVTIDLVSVTLVTPNGGETVFVNAPYVVQWTATHTDSIDVELSRDAGLTWTPIAGCTGLAGSATSCTWTPTTPVTTTARVQVTGSKQNRVARDVSAANFTIAQANQAPVASNGTLTTNEDTPATGVLSAIDDGPSLVFSIVSTPTKGSVSITNPATGAYLYTPNANANGADSFTFKVSDGNSDSNVATVNVTIVPVNDPPQAFNGSLSTNQNTAANGTLTAADIDGPTMTFAIVSNGTKGTAVITNVNSGAYTYTPNAGASGADSFTFQVTDGFVPSNVATISVTINGVNRPPVALSGVATNSPTLTVTGTVGATDPDGDPLTFAIVGPPTQGLASLNPTTGAFTYFANGNASGYDSFVYTASDGRGGTSTGTQMFIVVAAAPLWPGQTVKASVATSGASGDGTSNEMSIDASGRFVAYGSNSTNLVAGDTNSRRDIFVRDRQTNQTTRVSFTTSGAQITSGSPSSPALSADGRFVVYQRGDIYLYDRLMGVTTVVSVSSSGVAANNTSTAAFVSGDGRFVSFQSAGTNLVAGDTNAASDIFVRDRQTGQTTRVSVASDGAQANSGSQSLGISADGRVVLFTSSATNLVPGDTNGAPDVFVHDRQTGQTTRVSVASDGTERNTGTQYMVASVSANGRFVVFNTNSSNLVLNDTNAASDVFIHDRQIGETRRVSMSTDGAQANGGSSFPSVSADGRFVSFASTATNLVAGDTNGQEDLFVHDRQTGRTTRVNVMPNGSQSSATGGLSGQISGDGRFVTFQATAIDLTPPDGPFEDVFEVGGTTISPQQASFTAAGGSGSVNVSFVYQGGQWFATSPVPWISVTSPNGSATNNGTAIYTVAPNPTAVPRTATLIVASQLVTVTQEAAAVPTVTVSVTAPNGGETRYVGTPATIRWSSTGATSIDVALSRDNGVTFTPITGCVSLPGTSTSCNWTPTGPATSAAVIKVTATAGVSTVADVSNAAFTISGTNPSITVTAPNAAGVAWGIGTDQVITWTHNLGSQSFVRVELSRNSGTTWETLVASMQNTTATTGTVAWTPVGAQSMSALIRVSWIDGPVSDVSNNQFSIGLPSITVTAPNTSVTWTIGTTRTIIWTHNLGITESVRLDVSRDGVTWSPIANSVQNTGATAGSFDWVVTGPVSSARIRATWLENASVLDVSDVNFSIVSPITVTSPNTNVTWAAGSRRPITWTHSSPLTQSFNVDVSTNNGGTWTTMAMGQFATSATAGSTTIVMPTTPTTQALVRVSPTGSPGDGDVSNVPFTLAQPTVAVTAPNTNVNWVIGTSRNVTWSHNLGDLENVQLEASWNGGATWSVIASNTPNTGATTGTFAWVVTGPTTSAGRIRATWTSNASVQDVSDVDFRVSSPITVTSPNTSVTWAAGSRRLVTWTHSYGASQPFSVEVSTNNGATWTLLAAGAFPTSSVPITMPATPTNQAFVRVSPFGSPSEGDVSNVPFTLEPPTISVTSPNTNVNWAIGSNRNITWSHNLGDLEAVRIELSRDGGTTWELLDPSFPNTGNATSSWPWQPVSGPATTAGRVRVTWTQNGSVTDDSNVNFRIQ